MMRMRMREVFRCVKGRSRREEVENPAACALGAKQCREGETNQAILRTSLAAKAPLSQKSDPSNFASFLLGASLAPKQRQREARVGKLTGLLFERRVTLGVAVYWYSRTHALGFLLREAQQIRSLSCTGSRSRTSHSTCKR